MSWGGRRVRAAAAALLVGLGVSACSDDVAVPPSSSTSTTPASSATGPRSSTAGTTSSAAGTTTTSQAPDRLRVAISFDQPGIGLEEGGEYSGLDVDVARYVAQQLGVSRLSFVRAVPGQRETLLATGQVDMVISSYSMTPDRAEQVSFAGPYLVTGQDLLVERDSTVRTPGQLRGSPICVAEGSASTERLVARYTGLHLVEEDTVAACVERLRDGEVAAVSSDAAILAGYLDEDSAGRGDLRLAGRPFGRESYGIGLPPGDTLRCYQVSAALRTMVRSGDWRTIVEDNLPGPKVLGERTYAEPTIATCRSASPTSTPGAPGTSSS